MAGKLSAELRRAFQAGGRLDPLLLALFATVTGLVLFNTCVYEPNFPGDAFEFKRYTAVLAEGRLPDSTDSREFFTPPLPFVLPAGLLALGVPFAAAMKAGQVVNVGFCAALLVVVLLLVDELRPSDIAARRVALLLLALLPVYQHAFVYMRGEPGLALWAALSLLLAVRHLGREDWRFLPLAGLGVVMGLALLTRQQGVFILLAVTGFAGLRLLVETRGRSARIVALGVCLASTLAVSGWFYASLWQRYGTPMAFNKPRRTPSFANRPWDFYFGTGNGYLFTNPVRPAFTGQFLPTLYADAWGDYYGYFLVYVFDHRLSVFVPPWNWEERASEWRGRARYRTNRFTRPAYLGRTNLLGLFPTGLCLFGLFRALRVLARLAGPDPAPSRTLAPLLALAILLSLGGYFVLLLSFSPNFARGTTIKAIYMLQVFPLFAVLGAHALSGLRETSLLAFRTAVAGLGLLLAHNAPLLVTAYWPRP